MQPYPFGTWPKVGRAEALLLRRCARRIPWASPGGAADALAAILGAPAALTPLPLGVVGAGEMSASLADPLVAVVLGSAGPAPIAVELDPRLAACAVDRALGGEAGPAVPEPFAPLNDAERGVIAWIASRAVAAAGGRPWRILGVVTSPASLAFALGDAGAAVWSADVILGADRGTVRAWIPEAALSTVADDGRGDAGRLGAIPLTLVVEGARGSLSAEDLGALREGDVVVLDETWLVPRGARFGGKARVRVAGALRTVWTCAIDEDSVRVVQVERRHDAPTERGRRMEDEQRKTDPGAVDLAGDAPVEVTVELLRFSMPLEELASLRAGEVVLTGRAIGERVTLRAGDRAIGEGELVDVDGEVGVRLLALGR